MAVRDKAPQGLSKAVPALEPVPVPGCSVCESAHADRDPARAEGRILTALSCNGVIAGHPHQMEGAK
ncbi:hypothetical protein FM076_21175 [Streptomyces albus subsp. chlorinus]|uniref:hypothetical protein n=1 Tax=Streptomyces albus TaxID=1888 RepID=UPI00156F4311|nr:hypothetical protein [Streptomyces albus]NSC23527.1 hypothetical protein [Streptomyces albus subsp. chlorinus]